MIVGCVITLLVVTLIWALTERSKWKRRALAVPGPLEVIERERPLPVSQGCTRPPAGWICTREAGHDGPCAATLSAGLASPGRSSVLQSRP